MDLKHYHGVRVYETRRAPLAFRIQSACRHHMSHVLYADTLEETRTWMSLIEKHIKKQTGEHNCTPADLMIPGMNEDESVLDKWLDRLNLLDKEEQHATSSNSSSSVQDSSKSSSLSTSFPPVSTSFSSSTEKFDSTDSTEKSSSSSVSKLANAFVLSAHNSLSRRNNTSETKRTSSPPITLSRSSLNSSPPSMYKLSTREEDLSSTEDLFTFEQDHSSMHSSNDNKRKETPSEEQETVLSPYPVTPLSPPLRSNDRRKRGLSQAQNLEQ